MALSDFSPFAFRSLFCSVPTGLRRRIIAHRDLDFIVKLNFNPGEALHIRPFGSPTASLNVEGMDTPTRLKALGRSKSLRAIQVAGHPTTSSEVDVLRTALEELKGQVPVVGSCVFFSR